MPLSPNSNGAKKLTKHQHYYRKYGLVTTEIHPNERKRSSFIAREIPSSPDHTAEPHSNSEIVPCQLSSHATRQLQVLLTENHGPRYRPIYEKLARIRKRYDELILEYGGYLCWHNSSSEDDEFELKMHTYIGEELLTDIQHLLDLHFPAQARDMRTIYTEVTIQFGNLVGDLVGDPVGDLVGDPLSDLVSDLVGNYYRPPPCLNADIIWGIVA
ncbi:hypothetical protein BDP27DRAFT_1370780 [Rhodocollybia butyracea]|uniref:Uncharacterized protein n=1 Tax=Rhodocollybia butyracea TaxID=206335 RepID=A0A9P5P5Q9_9AGAR|nr:hypothetical protein BDP27DRAFT_1378412 [Rhodocollybia butyracea]KAF9060192.1 hypothetical protein BDP27DRAFT_1370780 [Rhodocollybia butyracea]